MTDIQIVIAFWTGVVLVGLGTIVIINIVFNKLENKDEQTKR